MAKKVICILYLDDEEHNLISFKAAFRREYKVFTTTSAGEAVQILNENEIHIVISDQKMPNISGVEFFELIIPDFPDPVRILLTGYADIEAVIDAINKGQVYRYIAKPWNEQELRITVENAYELYNNRKEIKEKNKELEKAYQELEKLVYSASHDLRSPLVSILGILKVARAENIDDVSREYFTMIERTVGKLDVFVQNIINYYQNVKQGEIISNVNFDMLVDEVIEYFQYFEGANEMTFSKNINQPAEVKLDTLRLKMILNNLVSNSIKYRDPQKSEKKLDVSVSASNEEVVLEVTDNGLGISREEKKKVFDMFYRSSDDHIGNGLGLYIVKEAIDRMSGTIQIESEPGVGSSFKIVLPNKHD